MRQGVKGKHQEVLTLCNGQKSAIDTLCGSLSQQITKALQKQSECLASRPLYLPSLIISPAKDTLIMMKRYKKEVNKNRKLYNEIQELKGNIRVYCRVRPLSSEESSNGDTIALKYPEDDQIHLNHNGQKKAFEFERVFNQNHTQEDVFRDTQPLVTSVLDGFNVCIFAYGQTGSGKTYTMEGPRENPGVNSRALSELFKIVEERGEDYRIDATVSILEIYNENIHDLLIPPAKMKLKKLDIKQGPDGMHVPDLTSVTVHNAEEVFDLLYLILRHVLVVIIYLYNITRF